MPIKRLSLWEYEEASGLQRGQLWLRLTSQERERLTALGYRSRCKLPNGALDYLLEIFPLPDHQTRLVSFSVYEKQCGFSKGRMRDLLSEKQQQRLHELGYRKGSVLPYRVILYLKSLGFY